MAIGEVGAITTPENLTADTPLTITLDAPLANPVYALSATSHDGDPFTMRVVSETTDDDGNVVSFDVVIEEYVYLDGVHGAQETINWVAVEAGIHVLPDGRILEAGTIEAGTSDTNVTLAGDHPEPPVVLTSVMSNNQSTSVDSDPLNVTEGGFSVRIQEEEGERGSGHAPETVGWIAVQPGGDAQTGTAQTHGGLDEDVDVYELDNDFDDPVVFAETQTIRGGDTATVRIDEVSEGQVGLFIEEEQSRDDETGHIDETVGLVAFDSGAIRGIPCFLAGTQIATPDGPRRIETLRAGELLCAAGGGTTRLRLSLSRKIAAHAPECQQPIRFAPGSLGQSTPKTPLFLSAQHRVEVRGRVVRRMFGQDTALVAAHRCLPLPGVSRTVQDQAITFWHLLCDRHVVLIANGAGAESLLLGPQALCALTPADMRAVAQAYPAALFGLTPTPAALIPSRAKQKTLIRRLLKNNHQPQPVLPALMVRHSTVSSHRINGQTKLRATPDLISSLFGAHFRC